ncbi:aminotransferase class III-fold pyridoxal phosphate-dependent enzyme (plasmid) [Falsihalocynthiibacter sp. SS001]|uniref:aminotransferase class III-fold pyridoxal phosphate-dependent enzyme n=1 Tax=Falsihalocynthiibacter sp. SS001 TaxID=3349698 RepID=UPI0036D37B17
MTQHWQSVLQENWGGEASLTRLDGEYDLNFLAEAETDYILKIMHVGCPVEWVDVQCQAIEKVSDHPASPTIIATKGGDKFVTVRDADGADRIAWLQTRKPGRNYADFSPKTPKLIREIGETLGETDRALEGLDHPALTREFKWNLTQGAWIAAHLKAISDPKRREILESILNEFSVIQPTLASLPLQAIHNDANDYNLLVTGTLRDGPKLSGLIDFGDICAAPRICDLAIAAAYLVLDAENPTQVLTNLAAGYHHANPLTENELSLLWPLLRMRLAVSVVNSTLEAIENPNDPYVTISQAPAWRFLEGNAINSGLLLARLRVACGMGATDAAPRILDWITENRGNFAQLMGQPLDQTPTGALSVRASTTPRNPFDLTDSEARDMTQDSDVWLGFYGEPRLIYTAPAFQNGPWKASNRRTVHLAVDVFAPAQTPLHAPLSGTVHTVENRDSHLDYGGVVILRHDTPEGAFFTLYGHLNPAVCETLEIGQTIEKDEVFAHLGDITQSGGWAPHVHFQLALSTDGMDDDWPGVADPDELDFWTELCPNPAALLNLPSAKTAYAPLDDARLKSARAEHFGRNVKLSYQEPLTFLRGWKHHLFDEWGRPYLDAYNNVPHVGHAHPRLHAIACDQLARMNSNTRYLHPAQAEFSETVLSKFPSKFSVCYFVNSGSEANELALRLARATSGGKDMITPNHGYHGNTTGAIDLSAYKFNAPGGIGQSDWVHLVDVADEYRGAYRRDDPQRAQKYADQVDEALAKIAARGGKLAGFIAETFPSVGGQIIPPDGYLSEVYKKIRAAGGICIADEVQTGLGRLGDYYFAFEQQKAMPDIVVLGKPIGNGHPIGVVVTTREIADKFAEGPEYFSTFGGSNLSCRMGNEVLKIVDDENLMQNARDMGNRLLDGLREMQERFDVVGDVRGFGLFVGVDLVEENRKGATDAARYVVNRLRDRRILIGTEGPADNVLKIRPPLTIEKNDIDMILSVLNDTFQEVTCLMGTT